MVPLRLPACCAFCPTLLIAVAAFPWLWAVLLVQGTGGCAWQIMRPLQGFIFFGTGNSLLNSIRVRIEDRRLPPLRCVILDFRRVSGLDSSAALSLAKAGQLARKSDFHLLLTQVPDEMQRHLERGFVRDERAEAPKFFPDLDHALEWWEERTLAEHYLNEQRDQSSLRVQLTPFWPKTDTLDSFLGRLERLVEQGQYLISKATLRISFILLRAAKSAPSSKARTVRRHDGCGDRQAERCSVNWACS